MIPERNKLTGYTLDGKLEIDNNLAENSIRPIALGRKNYLFAGSHEGARRAAMLYSFLASCKQHHVNPREWLIDVFTRIKDQPEDQFKSCCRTGGNQRSRLQGCS